MKQKNLARYIMLALIIIFIIFSFIRASSPESAAKKIYALDTYITIETFGDNAEDAAESAVREINRIERVFSAYNKQSEISRINSAPANSATAVSEETVNLIEKSIAHYNSSGGRFDITIKPIADLWNITNDPRVPSKEEIDSALPSVGSDGIVLDKENKTVTLTKEGSALDMGAIAKGYAADKAAEMIMKAGAKKALLNLGGNIIVIGEYKKNTPWTVGIIDPNDSHSGKSCIDIFITPEKEKYLTVVTSGAYERNFTAEDGSFYHHIINPKTAYPYESECLAVTVIGKSSTDADALSTSIYAMSPKEGLSYARSFGFDAVIITKDNSVYTTLNDAEIKIINDSYKLKKLPE